MTFRPILFVAAAAIATAAVAAVPVQLLSKVSLEKTAVVNGREQTQLSAPKIVVPGDRLLFETAYRNTAPRAVDNFVVTNPVPNGVSYAGQSSAGAEVSIDGGRNWGQLGQLKLRGASGQPRAATAADVTHLRWTVARIAPGGEGTLRYRGVVR